MSQRFSLYELLTVDQNIRFFGGIYGLTAAQLAERREFVLDMAGLAGRERQLARDLAGGWRQRLALGCAILHEPPILFLDEPTGGVDPLSRRQFWRLIDTSSQPGVTVLVTTHYLDEAERCHRVALIHAGRLAAIGTTTEVKRVFAGRPIVEVRADRRSTRCARSTRCRRSRRPACSAPPSTPCCATPASTPGDVAARLRRARHRRVERRRAGRAVARGRLPRRRRTARARGGGMSKALAVCRKELRQISRDRRTLLILVFVPAFFLLLYGYALNFDIRHVPLAVEDRDGTPESRAVVSAFVNSGYFDLAAAVYAPRDAERLLDLERRAGGAGDPRGTSARDVAHAAARRRCR